MTKVVSALDLISNAALVGAAAAFVVRPRFVSQLAQSQHLRQTRKLPDNVERRLTGRLASTRHLRGWQELARFGPRQLSSARSQDLTRKAGRRLNASAAMLALSVLADSAIEHYRGSFQNRAMYTPLVASTLTLGASLFGSADPRAQRHVVRDSIYALAAATGFAGTRVPYLQYSQASGRNVLAQSFLCRSGRRASGAGARRAARPRCRARARHACWTIGHGAWSSRRANNGGG